MWWRVIPWVVGALGISAYIAEDEEKIPLGEKVSDWIYKMDPIDVEGENPWWNVRPKDYDTAIVGLAVFGLLIWGTKS